MIYYDKEKNVNTVEAKNGKKVKKQYKNVLTYQQKLELQNINNYRFDVEADKVEINGELIQAAKAVGVEIKYHGKVYDTDTKQAIFDGCHFGLNVMKPTVFVGLTIIRLDEGRFIRPQTDPERSGGKICWSDFIMLTECAASTSTVIKYLD